jgi:hypothetical protein
MLIKDGFHDKTLISQSQTLYNEAERMSYGVYVCNIETESLSISDYQIYILMRYMNTRTNGPACFNNPVFNLAEGQGTKKSLKQSENLAHKIFSW